MIAFRDKEWSVVIAVLFSVAVSVCAVSSQSLWIDEAHSAVKATQPTFCAFAQLMSKDRDSDIQMPLYMALLWGWEKVFGSSEYALRALNIPLFVISCAVVATSFSLAKPIRILFVCFACISPFLLAYLDEARPYILQFFSATLILVGLVNVAVERNTPRLRNIILVLGGIIFLCGSSLLGVIYSFFLGLSLLVLLLRQESAYRILSRIDLRWTFFFFALVMSCLAVYYAWTLSVGARASGIGKSTPMSMAFCAYELLGFSGVGPGRSELREHPLTALRPFFLFLAFYATIISLFIYRGAREAASTRFCYSPYFPIAIAVLAGATGVTVLGIVADFRVIGRHLMPLVPFLLLVEACIALLLWKGRSTLSRGIVALLISAQALSCFSLRLSPRFAKDDYSTAATLAKQAMRGNKSIWWAADPAAGKYYKVFPKNIEKNTGSAEPSVITGGPLKCETPWVATLTVNFSLDQLGALPVPDFVFLSKVDIYDPTGTLRDWLKHNNFHICNSLPSFSVWRVGE